MYTLLVVDDDEMVRYSVSELLSNLGYHIIQAKNGLEATMVYDQKSQQIDLVIMDIVMPVMDGIAATKIIKDTYPLAKIILMSGYYNQTLPIETDAFLSKPFSMKALCENIEHLLKTA